MGLCAVGLRVRPKSPLPYGRVSDCTTAFSHTFSRQRKQEAIGARQIEIVRIEREDDPRRSTDDLVAGYEAEEA